MQLRTLRSLATTALVMACWVSGTHAQDRDRYVLGEEKQLEIVVHILGEVQKPGEYSVPDGTNVMELLSRAGGPTEFANLSKVSVTHTLSCGEWAQHGGEITVPGTDGPRVVRVNLKAYLHDANPQAVPFLHPGDVVSIAANGRSTWKFAAGIVRDLSVVATAYFLGVRAYKN